MAETGLTDNRLETKARNQTAGFRNFKLKTDTKPLNPGVNNNLLKSLLHCKAL